MRKKNYIIVILISCIVLYVACKVIYFFIWNSKISSDDAKPIVKLSQLTNVAEERVKYIKSIYINKEFIGFDASIDKRFFINVTKLGKISNEYKINTTAKRPDNNTQIFGFPVSFQESRYINLKRLPFKINKIYYYIENAGTTKINRYRFYEVESNYSFLNISFAGEDNKDFGYVGIRMRKSISFIIYEGNLYVLNLCPIDKNSVFISLHELSK